MGYNLLLHIYDMIPRTMASTGGAVGGSQECGESPPSQEGK